MVDFWSVVSRMDKEVQEKVKNYPEEELYHLLRHKYNPDWVADIEAWVEGYLLYGKGDRNED